MWEKSIITNRFNQLEMDLFIFIAHSKKHKFVKIFQTKLLDMYEDLKTLKYISISIITDDIMISLAKIPISIHSKVLL